MERFAFKIDKVLKANLIKICRLCGIDNPDKVPIIKDDEVVVDVDAEPEMSQKILQCVGLLISKNDKMPQMICSLCVDKVNDIYEFREMCHATNIQTRKLLGLKETPTRSTDIKVEIKNELLPATVEKRGRKRKSDDMIFDTGIKVEDDKLVGVNSNLSKKKMRLGACKQKNQIDELENLKAEVKNEPFLEASVGISEHDAHLKQICNICNERFGSKYKLDRHKFLTHTPYIPRYFCTTCDETLKKNGDIKSHQLWHKLTKTPYTCALCFEPISSTNLYTRHMRDHAQKLASPLVVLDRQCGQCQLTFCTNFLYNTHPCAVRTRKCGGCNRQIKADVDYLRHASTCDKAYLMVSKHLAATLEPVRIKNENDVEAAASSFGIDNIGPNITAPPEIAISNSPVDGILQNTLLSTLNKPNKKCGKKGMLKKDLKRIDDLIKSTMDTLVSIKHEPEVHVEADVTNQNEQHDNNVNEQNEHDEHQTFDDDFQNRDDSSSDEDGGPFVPIVELHTGSEIIIKKEPNDSTNEDIASTSKTSNVIAIKKELPDSGYEDSSSAGLINKVPVLKLKITKEHGTLNSSIVDESPTSREKKKKKKKRKDTEKTNEQTDNYENLQDSPLNTPDLDHLSSSELPAMPQPGIIRIKQERLDDGYPEENHSNEEHQLATHYSTDALMPPEATIMTSIPMMQFQISCVSSGVDFNEAEGDKEEQHDVKPNRAELDRWLENSSTISGMNSEVDSENELSRSELNISKQKQNRSQHVKKSSCRSKAVKSTGGISRKDSVPSEMPKIVGVSSGFEAIAAHNDNNGSSQNFTMPNITVKAEPCDDGYENIANMGGTMNSDHDMETSLAYEDTYQHSTDNVENDEQAYINSIDFNNISIKQEKDIDVSETQLTAPLIPDLCNGVDDVAMETTSNGNIDIGTEKSVESVSKITENSEKPEEDEEEMEHDEGEEENVEREYRELEWPPKLSETKNGITENQSIPFGLKITNVCSQANEHLVDHSESINPSVSEVPPKIPVTETTTLGSEVPASNEKEPDRQMAKCSARSMSLKIVENSDNLLESNPCSKSIASESNTETNPTAENIDEEHQNILNHEVLANSELQLNNRVSLAMTSSRQTATSANINSSSAMLTVCNEETDNFFNENVDADQRRQQEQEQESMLCLPASSNTLNLLHQRAVLVDDSNINEIAENNNNANIERELLDDNSTNVVRISASTITEGEDNNDEEVT